jgi:hypothetical protein
MELTWSDFKSVLVSRGVSVQYLVVGPNYWLKMIDGLFEVQCSIPIDPSNADTIDFETNHKPTGNRPLPSSAQAFAAKTLPNGKKLFARNVGFQQALTAGANTITYTATYPWAKLLGVEVINSEALDTVDFKVYDNALGSYSGYPNALLNQFAYSTNLPKDYYVRMSNFDADVYVGMVLQVSYTSLSAKSVGFNLILNEVK